MKKILKTTIIFLIILIGASLFNSVYASSFKFEVKADTSTLKPGDTVTITLKVSDIDAGELGINAIEGFLTYDENIFEAVTQDDFKGKNEWSITYNSENGKYLGVLLASGVKEDTEIATLKLKVRTGISSQETTIRFTEIATNDGVNLISEADKEIKLRIQGSGSQSGNGNQNDDNQTVVGQNKIVIDDAASGKIPQTGKARPVIIGIGVILVIIVAVVIFVRYKKIDK